MKLAQRNLQLYFRDLPAVTMSLLAEVIIMILYIMFIRDNLISSFGTIANKNAIMDAWMISGILGITPVTASMGAYGIMIEDKTKHILRDFKTSPLGATSIMTGYVLSAAVASIVLSMFVLFIGEGYMMLRYGGIAGAGNEFSVLGLILLNSLCISAIVILPISFINSNNALAGSCTIIGALIGFLTGIYMPIGTMGNTAQVVVMNFPISHGVMLFRQMLTERLIQNCPELQGETASKLMEHLGIIFVKNGIVIEPLFSILALVTTAVACLVMLTIKQKLW